MKVLDLRLPEALDEALSTLLRGVVLVSVVLAAFL
jgi:hypothetical protein